MYFRMLLKNVCYCLMVLIYNHITSYTTIFDEIQIKRVEIHKKGVFRVCLGVFCWVFVVVYSITYYYT